MRHLAALAAVAHEGSFRGAADALGSGQSAISQQVAHLEQMVGHRLFERRRGATPALTAAGELLVAHADEILVRLEAARNDLDGTRAPALDHLRVGTLESTSTSVMPHALVAMRRCEPGVRVVVTEADHGDDLLLRLAWLRRRQLSTAARAFADQAQRIVSGFRLELATRPALAAA